MGRCTLQLVDVLMDVSEITSCRMLQRAFVGLGIPLRVSAHTWVANRRVQFVLQVCSFRMVNRANLTSQGMRPHASDSKAKAFCNQADSTTSGPAKGTFQSITCERSGEHPGGRASRTLSFERSRRFSRVSWTLPRPLESVRENVFRASCRSRIFEQSEA